MFDGKVTGFCMPQLCHTLALGASLIAFPCGNRACFYILVYTCKNLLTGF